MQLFRQQALDHQNRLHGEIFLAPPLRWQIVGWLLLALTIVCGLFLALTSYGRTVSASGTIRAATESNNELLTRSGSEAGWIVELQAPLAQERHIALGKPVTLTVNGLPVQAFGSLQGRITAVGVPVFSTDAPFVPVIARLSSPTPEQVRAGLVLRQAMRVEAAIVVERASLLRWLFEPLLPAAR